MNEITAAWYTPYADKLEIIYWIDQLRSLPSLALFLCLTAGVLFLLYGRSSFRLIIILNAMAIAWRLGWVLGEQIHRPVLSAIGLAVIFGLLAWPMFKFGVAVFFGLIGTVLLSHLSNFFGIGQPYQLIISAVGFLGFAILGWFLLMGAVIFFTAFEGASLSILSLTVLLERAHVPLGKLPGFTYERLGLIHLAIVVLAILGLFYQIGFADKADKTDGESKEPDGQG